MPSRSVSFKSSFGIESTAVCKDAALRGVIPLAGSNAPFGDTAKAMLDVTKRAKARIRIVLWTLLYMTNNLSGVLI